MLVVQRSITMALAPAARQRFLTAGCRCRLMPNARHCFSHSLSPNDVTLTEEPLHNFESESEAKESIQYLSPASKRLLQKVLMEQVQRDTEKLHRRTVGDTPLTTHQIRALCAFNAIPFFGFGLLDNSLMIITAQVIDLQIGIALGISTMAAAALGNALSDLAGLGREQTLHNLYRTAHYLEFMAYRLGVKMPYLTADQWHSHDARKSIAAGRAFGLLVGCLLGMLPLIFFRNPRLQDADDVAGAANEDSHGDDQSTMEAALHTAHTAVHF